MGNYVCKNDTTTKEEVKGNGGGEDDRENVEKMPRIKTPSIIAGIQPEAALELIWCDAKKLQLHSQPKKKTLDKESRMGNLKRYLTNQFKYKKGTL